MALDETIVPSDGYISEEVMDKALVDWAEKNPHGVPLYLEGRTVIGKVTISSDGKHIQMDIDDDSPIAELMTENLIGLSTMTMHADRASDIINKEKDV